MRTRSIIVLSAVLTFQLAAIGAANAFPLKQQMSPADLKVSCEKNGGAYGAGPDSGSCVGKSGNIVTCGNDKHCEGQVIHARTTPDSDRFGSAVAGHHASSGTTASSSSSARAAALSGGGHVTTSLPH